MQTRPGLLRGLLTFRVSLVIEHVGVTAFFPEIFRESVTSPHDFEPRIFRLVNFYRPLLGMANVGVAADA
jgi:hypothetical protein